jgi:hypothetical protein
MSSIDCAMPLANFQWAIEVSPRGEAAPWSAAACRRFRRELAEDAQKAAASCRTPRRGSTALIGVAYATEVPA